MKRLLALVFLLGSIGSARADLYDFNGSYDQFRVLDRNGQLTMIDLDLGSVYTTNYMTGEETNFDVNFLKYSRVDYVRENARYVKSATISSRKMGPNVLEYEIKAKIEMPLANSSGTFDALLVFKGTLVKSLANSWEQRGNGNWEQVTKEAIYANMMTDRLEDVSKNKENSMLFAGLSLILKLIPGKGFDTTAMGPVYHW